jgi:hypothetical protein
MITMMMEMTIATIGLLIKNFDMVGYLFSAGAGVAGFFSGVAVSWAAGAPGVKGFGLTVIPSFTF